MGTRKEEICNIEKSQHFLSRILGVILGVLQVVRCSPTDENEIS